MIFKALVFTVARVAFAMNCVYTMYQDEKDDIARAEYILDCLFRRSDSDYMLFLEALIATGQTDLVDRVLKRPTTDISDGI